jgi:pyruvate formate lyase activating enzyme
MKKCLQKEIESKKGIIFDIKRYAIHDGPGIRTTVFFKGCPLRCLWCCNPESYKMSPEIIYTESRCIHCDSCQMVCPNNAIKISKNKLEIIRENCNGCGICAIECPANALELSGKPYSVKELLAEVEKDSTFYQKSEGGITVSGGECTMQSEFLLSFLKKCKENYLHVTLDTCGFVEWNIFKKIIEYVDLVLFDVKIMNEKQHIKCTSKSNKLILENLNKLSKIGIPVIIRIPLIPGFNDSEKEISAMADTVSKLKNIQEVNILPYHRLGESKHTRLGNEYKMKNTNPPNDPCLEKTKNFFMSKGIKIKISG